MPADRFTCWPCPQLALRLPAPAQPTPALGSHGPPVAPGSICSADARTGTMALSPSPSVVSIPEPLFRDCRAVAEFPLPTPWQACTSCRGSGGGL